MADSKNYNVAFSFASEQAQFVRGVVDWLNRAGIRSFYDDEGMRVRLWGKDLAHELDRVYRLESDVVVVMVSKQYAEKVWTRREFQSALKAPLNAGEPYVLPARFDDTELAELSPTIAYIDLRHEDPLSFAQKILAKLGRPAIAGMSNESVRIAFDEPAGNWLVTPPTRAGYGKALATLDEHATVVPHIRIHGRFARRQVCLDSPNTSRTRVFRRRDRCH